MQRLKVWFDLDGVLVPSVEWVEDLVSIEIGYPFRFTKYNPEDMGVDRSIVEIVYRHFDPRTLGKVPPSPEMIDMIEELKQTCDVGILTARNPDEQGLAHTYSQCLRYFGIEPILAGRAPKVNILERNKVHVFVEDCYTTAYSLINSFTVPMLINKPYNQGYDYGIVRVHDSEQILREIKHIHWMLEFYTLPTSIVAKRLEKWHE